MSRTWRTLAQGLHDSRGLGPAIDRLHAGNEATLLDQQFVLDGNFEGIRHEAGQHFIWGASNGRSETAPKPELRQDPAIESIP
jgi:hypothetical protein